MRGKSRSKLHFHDSGEVRPHALWSSSPGEAADILRARAWCGLETTHGWTAPFDVVMPVLFSRREDLEAWLQEGGWFRRCNVQHHVDAQRAAQRADAWLSAREEASS